MRITTRIDETGKITLTNIEEYLNLYFTSTQLQCKQVADAAVREMGSYIDRNRKRPANYSGKSNLISALTGNVEVVRESPHKWRISLFNPYLLDEQAPYWYVLNFGTIRGGGHVHPGHGAFFKGTFADGMPRRGASGQPWYSGGVNTNGRSYLMTPTKPIEGIHYLNHGVNFIRTKMRRLTREIPSLIRREVAGGIIKTRARRIFGIKTRNR